MKNLIMALTVISILNWGCDKNEESAGQNGLVEVMLTEGTNMAVALSPDQSMFALDLQGTIWTLPAAGGDATPITDELGDCHEPSWSPEGARIIFHSYRDGNYHIWSVNKDGSDLIQHTSGKFDDREPVWSSSGSIYFSSDRAGSYDIWKIQTDGSLFQLTDLDTDEYYPSLSIDNRKLSYVINHGDKYSLQSLDLQESRSRQIYESIHSLSSPTWNSDHSRWIAVEYDGFNSRLIGTKDGSDESVGYFTEMNEDVFPFRVAWKNFNTFYYTADGLIKFYDNTSSSITIPFNAKAKLDRNPYKRKEYDLDEQLEKKVLGILSPMISPDEKFIVFSALGDLWVYNLENGDQRKITSDKFVDLDPYWSPDSKLIVFSSDRLGKMDLYIYDVSSQQTRLVHRDETSSAYPVWSPDGQRIAYFSRDPDNIWVPGQLNILNLQSKNVVSVEGSFFAPSRVSWSPNGKFLAMIALHPVTRRYREGFSEIYIFNLENGKRESFTPKKNTSAAMRNTNGPVWSVGDEIVYISAGTLWSVSVNQNGQPNGNPSKLSEDLASSPSMPNSAHTVYYMSMDQLKRVDLVDNTTEVIRIDLNYTRKIPVEKYVIHAGKLFDGISNQYHENVDLVIEGAIISSIGPHQERPGLKVIDASDKTVIPALIESHAHQHAAVGEKLGRTWLAFGITSVREPGGNPYDALYRKETWTHETNPGPRVFYAGGLTDGSRIYYDIANSMVNSDQVDLEMERAKRLEYDLIKTYVRLEDSIQQKITIQAHAMGIPVSSHEIYPSTKYNVDGVEHIRGTSRRGYSPKQTQLKKTYQDVINLLVGSQMHITPTIGLQGGFYVILQKDSSLLHNLQYRSLYSEEYREKLMQRVKILQQQNSTYLANFESIQKFIIDLSDAGGWLLAGTDSPFIPYGYSLLVELQIYVDCGLTPFQALQSATIQAAKALHVDGQLGSLETGKLADLVILEGDPLRNIKDVMNVVATYKNGKGYTVEKLLE